MTKALTPGRWRGLRLTSNTQNVFTIMAFDQRGTFTQMLPADTPYDTAVAIKSEVVRALSPLVSAVLLDAEYGLTAALELPKSTGLLMAVEKSGYSGDSTYRHAEMYPDWNVEKIKRMGAAAVKMLVYYHPGAGTLAEEIEALVATICKQCHDHDLPLFLEPISYSLDANVEKSSAEFAEQRPEIVRETAQRLNRLQPDVLKLEFPVDVDFDSDQNNWRAACEAVSAACDVPWVLLSAGVDYDVFEPQVRVACQSGASGFLAGRAIWKESIPMTATDRQGFLAATGMGADRLKRLTELTDQYGRPWTDFYQHVTPAEGWYNSY